MAAVEVLFGRSVPAVVFGFLRLGYPGMCTPHLKYDV